MLDSMHHLGVDERLRDTDQMAHLAGDHLVEAVGHGGKNVQHIVGILAHCSALINVQRDHNVFVGLVGLDAAYDLLWF